VEINQSILLERGVMKEKVITFIIRAELDAKIEKYAEKHGRLKRSVITEAIETFFTNMESKRKIQ
jgi:predicted DNA-binding protein